MTPVSVGISAARARFAILALSLGSFGIGTTEFVVMGLLPDITQELLPGLYAADPDQALAQTGALVTAYALGVVVGAPLLATLGARFPRKGFLLVMLLWFCLASAATAALPSLELVVAARFVAGLPHGAYFGVAALVAATLLGPQQRARGVALVLMGLTVANIVGVPFASWIGHQFGWRVAIGVVALIFGLTVLAVSATVPRQPGDPGATVRSELGALARGRLWLALATGAIGFGGFFALYTFVSPLATEVAGLPIDAVPWLLALMGIGMTVGTLLSGRVADWNLRWAMVGFFLVTIASLVLVAVTAGMAALLFVGTFLVCVGVFGTGPAIQLRLMDVAGRSQTLAASLNHAGLNLGNAFGALLASVVVGAGWGFVAPIWLGAGLAVVGLGIAAVSFAIDRRRPIRR